jgi:hypothetical protein
MENYLTQQQTHNTLILTWRKPHSRKNSNKMVCFVTHIGLLQILEHMIQRLTLQRFRYFFFALPPRMLTHIGGKLFSFTNFQDIPPKTLSLYIVSLLFYRDF